MKQTNNGSYGTNGGKPKMPAGRASKRGPRVTEERAKAQRAKLDTQAEVRHLQDEKETAARQTQNKKKTRQDLQAKRRLIETQIEAYIQDHIGGNHSEKTLEWHRTALGLMRLFLQEELDITQIDDVEAEDISAWFAHMRKTPGGHGKIRSERTIQTYARSARAFFHWLVRRGPLDGNPFEHVGFPKSVKQLIQTVSV